ncbi:hypothetical protein IWW45_005533 [Coemansia sp. RSA 485]|nr:hypothetical protein IWW45_005533 [Coemansia sp. RSA 485]
MASMNYQAFIKKAKDVDHDLRGMAVSDLINQLKNPSTPLSKDDGERYAEALIDMLQDPQSYVQNLAMECLGQLVNLISPNTSQAAIISICSRIQDTGKDAGNNALSVALRVVVSKISENEEQKSMLAHMATPVVNTLEKSEGLSTDVMVDIFGALFEILSSSGTYLAADSEAVANVQSLLLRYISHKSIPVRRRAIEALGKFVVNTPGKRSEQALDTIFKRYQTSDSEEDSGVLLRVLVTIIRQSSQRVESLVPVIVDTELKIVDESERERRVVSLVAFETIIRHCLKYAQERRDEIYDAAVRALKYDPNYNYDTEDEEGDDVMDTGSEDGLDEFGDDFDEDIYEDDEDDSWDIRLNGVKLLSAFIKSGLYTPDEMVGRIGVELISCFKEREDIVRAEILLAYATILDQLKTILGSSSAVDMEVEYQAPAILSSQVPRTVSSLISVIKNYTKSTETKQLSFAIFSRLMSIDSSILDDLLPSITPLVIATLAAEDTAGALKSASTSLVKTNLKLDALDFLLVFVGRQGLPDAAADFLVAIKDGIVKSVSSKTFQAPMTSVYVANDLVRLLRVSVDQDARDISQFKQWIHKMAELALLNTSSKDTSLSKSCYVFLGTLLQQFGDMVDGSAVDQCLETLVAWKSGSSQDLDAISALTTAVTQPTHLPSAKVLGIAPRALEQADKLLIKNDQTVSNAGLGLIKSLADYGAEALSDLASELLNNIIHVINRTPVSPPSLALYAFASVCPFVPASFMQSIAPSLVKGLSSAAIYDKQSASALSKLFHSVGSKFPEQFEQWSDEILQNWCDSYAEFVRQRASKGSSVIQVQFPSQMLSNASKSILALHRGYLEANGQEWSNEFLAKYIGASAEASVDLACLALRSLGYASLSGLLSQDRELVDRINELVKSGDDDLRSEAATALGNYAGSHTEMLSEVFDKATDSEGIVQLSYLQAVQVAVDHVVGRKRNSKVAESAWRQITQYVQNTQKQLPDIIAQSLAVFAVAFPKTYIPFLATCISTSGSNAHAKTVFITAFRTLLAHKSLCAACDEQIKLVLSSVLSNIADSDVNIRRLSLLAMYTILQTKPVLIEDIVGSLQPELFSQTKVDDSLIRFITMGPYTRKIDDGLETRKCAYQCVYMLVRSLPHLANEESVIDCVVRGINDEQEIRTVVQQIVGESISKMAGSYASNMAAILDAIEKALGVKLPNKAVKHEIEKHQEMLRSAVFILVHLEPVTKLPGCDGDRYEEVTKKASEDQENGIADYYKELIRVSANSTTA